MIDHLFDGRENNKLPTYLGSLLVSPPNPVNVVTVGDLA